MGDDAARFRGAWLRRVSQGPRPIGNLDRLIANRYLEGRLRAAFFRPVPRLENSTSSRAGAIDSQNPGHVRAPRLIPPGRGVLFGRVRIHHPDITAFA